MDLDSRKMDRLDELVLDHYMLWFALTAVTNVEDDLRYRALKRYYTARGCVV